MGELPEPGSSTMVMTTAGHDNLLKTAIGDADLARVSKIYTYGRSFNGSVARLLPHEAKKLSDDDRVVSVFPNAKLKLHTTRSWDFLGLPGNTKKRNFSVKMNSKIAKLSSVRMMKHLENLYDLRPFSKFARISYFDTYLIFPPIFTVLVCFCPFFWQGFSLFMLLISRAFSIVFILLHFIVSAFREMVTLQDYVMYVGGPVWALDWCRINIKNQSYKVIETNESHNRSDTSNQS
ncbi:uncharacterized protein LOC133711519 [Rosa rugosa]|uniref:uncharacterized protein LOC133711519 n=1 Tax=Rosa rugosa TaxID=74645 RepID=UPI002B4039D4|nr:uncharacterized protein LOC133711519 [Rosa rugosa]